MIRGNKTNKHCIIHLFASLPLLSKVQRNVINLGLNYHQYGVKVCYVQICTSEVYPPNAVFTAFIFVSTFPTALWPVKPVGANVQFKPVISQRERVALSIVYTNPSAIFKNADCWSKRNKLGTTLLQAAIAENPSKTLWVFVSDNIAILHSLVMAHT